MHYPNNSKGVLCQFKYASELLEQGSCPVDLDRLEFDEPERHEGFVASYYPMVGVFRSNEELEEAFRRTKRPGESVKIESQEFGSTELAVGALMGRHPDFIMTGMIEFTMAKVKDPPAGWELPNLEFLLWNSGSYGLQFQLLGF